MKSNTHPNWNSQVTVTCSCGNTFTTGSVVDSIHVDVCSACHPFYTGQMKFIDLQGRVDKFLTKRKAAAEYTGKKDKKKENRKEQEVLSLRELLQKEKSKLSANEAKTPGK